MALQTQTSTTSGAPSSSTATAGDGSDVLDTKDGTAPLVAAFLVAGLICGGVLCLVWYRRLMAARLLERMGTAGAMREVGGDMLVLTEEGQWVPLRELVAVAPPPKPELWDVHITNRRAAVRDDRDVCSWKDVMPISVAFNPPRTAKNDPVKSVIRESARRRAPYMLRRLLRQTGSDDRSRRTADELTDETTRHLRVAVLVQMPDPVRRNRSSFSGKAVMEEDEVEDFNYMLGTAEVPCKVQNSPP